jgi:hypothetical protein
MARLLLATHAVHDWWTKPAATLALTLEQGTGLRGPSAVSFLKTIYSIGWKRGKARQDVPLTCSVLALHDRDAGSGNKRGPKERSQGQVTFKPVCTPYTRDVLTEVSNNVTVCYGRKPCGMDAKLPKGECDAKLPNQ